MYSGHKLLDLIYTSFAKICPAVHLKKKKHGFLASPHEKMLFIHAHVKFL
jgi:hypothetical protein